MPTSKMQFVTVKPDRSGDQLTWKVKHKEHEAGPGQYPIVKLAPNSGNHDIVITLKDDADDIEFAAQPIWIDAVTCPEEGGAQPPSPTNFVIHPQVDRESIEVFDGTQLVFTVFNTGDPVCLAYRLNFTEGAPPLDPIIQNGGGTGTGPGTQYDFLTVAVVGAVAFLLRLFAVGIGKRLAAMFRQS